MSFQHLQKLKVHSAAGYAGIIILNRDKCSETLECINSIYSQSYRKFIIVVVDNASTDNSCEMISQNYPEVILIRNNINKGVAGGRNTGIKFIIQEFREIEFILFIDNDAVMNMNALEELVSPFKHSSSIGIVTPKVLRPDGTIEYAGGIQINLQTGLIKNIGSGQKDSGRYDKASEKISSAGGIFIIKRKILNDVGLFDEAFNPYGWEDVDLSIRVKNKGYGIYYNPAAVIFHKGGQAARGFIKDYELPKLKNYFYLVRKHSGIGKLILFYILFPLRLIVLGGRYLRNRILLPQLKGFWDSISLRFR